MFAKHGPLTAPVLTLFAAPTSLAPHPLYAQLLQGTINVADPSQAAVAEATVTDEQTNFTCDTRTNSTGSHTVATLPPGTYRL